MLEKKIFSRSLFLLFVLTTFCSAVFAQDVAPVSTATLKAEVRDFMAREMAVHFGDIKTLNPPPDRVVGGLTTGDFSWGSFMRALAAQADIGGTRTIAGKDTARAIAEMGLIEARHGSKSFSQLYSTLALRHYGTDLSKNAVWLSMNDSERKEWGELLDPKRFYDAKKRQVINLPENYLGVAARVSAMSFQMGVLKDRAFLDSVVERAAEQFTDGAIYADDNPPTGRYDRYSNEYARFCWDAASIAGRKDILEKLKPSLKEQMKLWWDLVSPKAYGYNWGRSQGLVSYLDTLEIAAFLGEHPEFRPAPLVDIAATYNLAWRWLRKDYSDKTHLFTVFAFGRGNYSYISLDREWQQTGTGFGKIILAHDSFMKTLERENITQIPASINLPNVARFQFFIKNKDKQEGVWLVRKGKFQFTLPITTGTKPGVADYLPAPYGLPGILNPVEEVYPSLVPFLELADGKTYAASEGSDLIEPAADAQSLHVFWSKYGQIGSKSGERFDIGLTTDVRWRIEGNKLIRQETISAAKDVDIKRWWVAVPSTGNNASVEMKGTARTDIFEGRDGTLAVSAKMGWPVKTQILATGDSRLGKGVLGPMPFHLIYESENLKLKKGQKLSWELSLDLLK